LKTLPSKPGTAKPGSVQTRVFRAGEVIFREGDDPRDEAYLVHAGRVDVRKTVGDEQRLLRTYVKGELLGELGLFGGAPRSATAVAAEPVTLVVIPARRLHHLVRTNPTLAVAIIRDLSVKLRATNELLAAEGRRGQARPGRVTS
jgi:CRP/FNR family transcriptional regulator, cyclic AMP receptor protein